ncbi:MAG: DUF1697 domain-containing protein [Nannocystaceae bacterium]
MAHYAAFLRGMNLGGRRITNQDLCACFEALGLADVAAFLASGNVVFTARGAADAIARRIERGLAEQLDYEVPTFVRGAAEVQAIAARRPFAGRRGADARGKAQVLFLAAAPAPAASKAALALASDDDWLELEGRECYWLPAGRLSDSALDLKALERALGMTTIRTKNTVDRLAARHFA